MPTDDEVLWTTRDYRPADGPALYALWAAAGGDNAGDEASFCARLGADWVRVACLEGHADDDGDADLRQTEIIGFAAICLPGTLDLVATAPDWQGQGIARTLIDDLDFLAAAMGARAITTQAPATLHGFFQRCGFQLKGTTLSKPLS